MLCCISDVSCLFSPVTRQHMAGAGSALLFSKSSHLGQGTVAVPGGEELVANRSGNAVTHWQFLV